MPTCHNNMFANKVKHQEGYSLFSLFINLGFAVSWLTTHQFLPFLFLFSTILQTFPSVLAVSPHHIPYSKSPTSTISHSTWSSLS
jgi:hypothetical protein